MGSKKKATDKGKNKEAQTIAFGYETPSIKKGAYFWWAAVIPAVITFLAYLPALQNGFVNRDDNVYVYENPYIQSIDLGLLGWIPSVVIWHPLTMLSLAIDYALWGLNPIGYHLTNNTLHSINTFLVFILTVLLINSMQGYRYLGDVNKRVLIVGSVTAFLFGIHPLHVESVAWVSERKDVLCGFFFLLTLLMYIKYATACAKKQKFIYYLACFTFFICALLSKPMAVSLPLVMLIIDFYPLKRISVEKLKKVLLEKLPFILFSLLISLTAVWVHYAEKKLPTLEYYHLSERMLSALRAYIFYLGKMIVPINLATFYPLPNKIGLFVSVEYFGAFILILIISLFAIRSIKKNNLYFSAWLYYLIALLPVIGFVQVGGYASAADRYTYLPSIGPFLLVGLGVGLSYERFSGKLRNTFFIIFIIISAFLISRTLIQISTWRNSVTLWTHELKLYPDATIAYNMRGIAYYNMGQFQQAIIDYTEAVEIAPEFEEALINRGNAFYSVGDYQQAITDYSKALDLNPQRDAAYSNRGSAYAGIENYSLAIKDFNEAIRLNPNNARAYYNLALIYLELNSYEQALGYQKKAATLGLKQAQDYLSGQGIAW